MVDVIITYYSCNYGSYFSVPYRLNGMLNTSNFIRILQLYINQKCFSLMIPFLGTNRSFKMSTYLSLNFRTRVLFLNVVAFIHYSAPYHVKKGVCLIGYK